MENQDTQPVQASENVVVLEPKPESSAPAAKQLPLVSIILTGVATLMALIALFGRFSFWGLMEFSCLAALVVGMILCKKEQNLIVAIGFFALALFGMVGGFISFGRTISNGFGVLMALVTTLFSAVEWLCNAAIGVTYLCAKPKLAVLKTVVCAVTAGFSFLMLIAALFVQRGSGAASLIFTFLLQTVTLYAAAILYTPFKK